MLRCGSKRCLEARYADRVATPSHLPSNLDARRSLFLRPRIASLPSTLNGDPSGSPGGKPFRLKSTARVALVAWVRRGQGPRHVPGFCEQRGGGICVVLETAEAAIRKRAEFRDEGFRMVLVRDAAGTVIGEAELAAIVQTDAGSAGSWI